MFPVVLYVVSVFGSGGKKVLVKIHMYYSPPPKYVESGILEYVVR